MNRCGSHDSPMAAVADKQLHDVRVFHIFLAVAVCVGLVNIIQGRRAGQEALDCFSADRMRGRALLGGIVMLVVGKKRS